MEVSLRFLAQCPREDSVRGRKRGGDGWGGVVPSSLTLTCRHNNSTLLLLPGLSLSGQFYRVASCDWWPVASERAIFHRHFHCPHSRSSILCGCLRCLWPLREAGWHRRLMTTGLAGWTHPSAERRALSFDLFTFLLFLYKCISFTSKCAVNFRYRRRQKEGRWEEKRDSGGWERKRGWGRRGRGRDMHQTRTTAHFIQGNLLK